jgi:hypothetical protein
MLKFKNFIKICPVGAELFHADGRTDMTKLIVLRTRVKKQKNEEQKTRWRNKCEKRQMVRPPDTRSCVICRPIVLRRCIHMEITN